MSRTDLSSRLVASDGSRVDHSDCEGSSLSEGGSVGGGSDGDGGLRSDLRNRKRLSDGSDSLVEADVEDGRGVELGKEIRDELGL